MNHLKKNVLLSVSALGIAVLLAFTNSRNKNEEAKTDPCLNPAYSHLCVMKTIFGLDTNNWVPAYGSYTTEKVEASIKKGLEWIGKAQANDGGWGAGTHMNQNIMDPHAVQSDPATTSLICMSLLRTDNDLQKGAYAANLKKGINFLLNVVETCPDNQPYLTTLTNTQPQVKLGRNIDVILTAQCLTNLLHYEIKDEKLKKRIESSVDKCVVRIQKGQDADGSFKDGGWAPVLQSALANNALESADDAGRKVDKEVLKKSRQYQSGNFDLKTNAGVTDRAAGVVLYGLSSTTRASAKESRRARDIVAKAKAEGLIKNEEVTVDNLKAAGISVTDAKELATAYSINDASRQQALREDVMSGFGSNGGEEFMSYLMTGESVMMQGGNEWKKWYDMISGKLVAIQNNDGSWNGHHCITSPVFCTGTCLLILSIQNDMQFNINQHLKKVN